MLIRMAVLSLALYAVTGCTNAPTTPLASNSTQAAKPQTSRLNTIAFPKSQRYTTDRQNQLDDQGYSDGYSNGFNGLASNPSLGIANQNLTDPTEQKVYTDAYDRGYAQGKGEQPLPSASPSSSPSPSPSPTGAVSPQRRAELQQWGTQDGKDDAQAKQTANSTRGIYVWVLTNPTEIQIYTAAYNAAYQQASRPTTIPSGRLSQLKRQGYDRGYADAQANSPQDASSSINLAGLVDATEQQAYTTGYNSGYNSGYQAYRTSQQPPLSPLW